MGDGIVWWLSCSHQAADEVWILHLDSALARSMPSLADHQRRADALHLFLSLLLKQHLFHFAYLCSTSTQDLQNYYRLILPLLAGTAQHWNDDYAPPNTIHASLTTSHSAPPSPVEYATARGVALSLPVRLQKPLPLIWNLLRYINNHHGRPQRHTNASDAGQGSLHL